MNDTIVIVSEQQVEERVSNLLESIDVSKQVFVSEELKKNLTELTDCIGANEKGFDANEISNSAFVKFHLLLTNLCKKDPDNSKYKEIKRGFSYVLDAIPDAKKEIHDIERHKKLLEGQYDSFLADLDKIKDKISTLQTLFPGSPDSQNVSNEAVDIKVNFLSEEEEERLFGNSSCYCSKEEVEKLFPELEPTKEEFNKGKVVAEKEPFYLLLDRLNQKIESISNGAKTAREGYLNGPSSEITQENHNNKYKIELRDIIKKVNSGNLEQPSEVQKLLEEIKNSVPSRWEVASRLIGEIIASVMKFHFFDAMGKISSIFDPTLKMDQDIKHIESAATK